MSTRARAAVLTAGVLLAAPPAAAEGSFEPVVELRAYNNGNVNVLGPNEGDSALRLAVDLPWTVRRPLSTFRVLYRPYFEVYSSEDSSRDFGHALSAIYSRNLSRLSGFSTAVRVRHSEQQGLLLEDPDLPSSLVPRTPVFRAAADIRGRMAVGPRSYLDLGLGTDFIRYEDIPPTVYPDPAVPDLPGIDFVDSDLAELTLGWGMAFTPRLTAGLVAGYRYVAVEEGEDTTVATLAFDGRRDFERGLRASLRIGALQAKTGEFTSTEPALDLSLSRELSRNSSLSAGLRQAVSGGNGFTRAASLDSGGWVNWDWWRLPSLHLSAGAGFWRREAIEGLGAEKRGATRTVQTTESASWMPGNRMEYGVFHTYRDQGGYQELLAEPGKGYHAVGLFLRWHVKGRRTGDGPGGA